MHQTTTQQGAARAKAIDIATAFRGYKERRIFALRESFDNPERSRRVRTGGSGAPSGNPRAALSLSKGEGSAAALVVAALCLLAAAPAAIGGAGPHVVLDGNQSVVSVQEDAASAQIAVIFTNVPAGTTALPSLSIGLTGQPSRFTKNPIATGSFGSACNAGDDYVTPSTVQTSRTSPWAGTVRATFSIVICNDDVPETWKKDLVIELVDGTGYHVHSALGTLRTTIRIVDDDFESSDVTVTPNAMTGDPAIRFTWTPPPAGVAYDFAPAYKKATSDTWVAVARDDTTGSAGGMSFTEGLETGVSYDVQLHEIYGGKQVASAPIGVTTWTVPGKPTGVSLTADANGINVNWTAPTATGGTGATITGYVVRWRPGDVAWSYSSAIGRDPTSPGGQGPATLSGPLGNADTGTSYYFPIPADPPDYEVQVRALNGIDPGSEWSDLAGIDPGGNATPEPEAVSQSSAPVTGTNDSDELTGGSGNDLISGKKGDDILRGKKGNDELHGQDGDDELYGGAGKDKLHGGAGNDELRGGAGRDKLFGKRGKDELYGGPGEDELHGGLGDDKLYGEAGDDELYGGRGDDTYTGGPGADQFIFAPDETGDKIITDFGDVGDLIVLKTEGQEAAWASVSDIIAGGVAQGDRYMVYTLSEDLTVETDTALGAEDFRVD